MTSAHSAPTVSVHATAHLDVTPDSFVLYASVSGTGSDSAAALQDLAGRYAQLEDAASRLPASVEVRHGELHSWSDGRKRDGWHAQRTATLTGRDTAAVAAVAGALGELAGLGLNGPEWRVDRDNRAYGEVQQDAVEEARARAERYAAALGGSLGRLVELSDPEGAHGFAPVAMAMHSRAEEADLGMLDYSPQQVTLSATVQARWYLVLPD
jgi:uncharacterized protein YggE